MKINDAFTILNISGEVTPTDIKIAYRKAAAKYHPDHNPAGLEMMKLVNLAYEVLKDFEGLAEQQPNNKNYDEAVNDALNAIIDLGLEIELCGAWVWVSGDTRPHRETLKAAGYQWTPKKARWYFRPAEHKSFNRSSWSMDKIRETYGSSPVQQERQRLATAH